MKGPDDAVTQRMPLRMSTSSDKNRKGSRVSTHAVDLTTQCAF